MYAFITLGISSFVAWRYYAHVAATREIQQSIANNMVAVTAEHQAYVMGSPQRIIIPGLVINLPIVAGNYDKEAQEWSLSNTSANFATNTNNPNNKGGKTLIYGHALASIFGKLNKLSSNSKGASSLNTFLLFEAGINKPDTPYVSVYPICPRAPYASNA